MFINARNGDNPSKYIPVGLTSLLIVAALIGGGVVLKNYFGDAAAAASTPNLAAAPVQDRCPMEAAAASMPHFILVTPQVMAQMKDVAVAQVDAVKQAQTLKAISYVQVGGGTFSSDPTTSLDRLRLLAMADSFGDVHAKTGPCGMDGYLTMKGYVGGKPTFQAIYTLIKQPAPGTWRVGDVQVQLLCTEKPAATTPAGAKHTVSNS